MKLRVYMVLLFVLIICMSLIVAKKSSDFSQYDYLDHTFIANEAFTPSIGAYNFRYANMQHNVYEVSISGEDLPTGGQESLALVLYRLSDNAHNIYFNDILIGSQGDMANGQSNLWNGLFSYPVEQSLILDQNHLRIETLSTYRSGLSSDGLYFYRLSDLNQVYATLNFYGERMNTFMIGFIFFSSLITLIFFFISERRNTTFLMVSVATIMTGIYYSDYLVFTDVIIPYLVYKKIVMSALFIGVGFYSYVVARYFQQYWVRLLGHITIWGFGIIVVFSQDMVRFKELYSFWYLMILINVFAWLFLALYRIKKQIAAFIFLISFITIAVYGSVVVVMDWIGGYYDFNSPALFISIYAFIPLLLIYEAILEKELLLKKERNLREIDFLNSMTDKLTGTWNRRYYAMIEDEVSSHYAMALMDIDNFKAINDTYGHLAGDQILIQMTDILQKNLRKTDIVCRYGGDEFVIIMKECEKEEAYRIMEGIRYNVESQEFLIDDQVIHATISIGLGDSSNALTYKYAFKEVDQRLYQAKAQGKNRVAS